MFSSALFGLSFSFLQRTDFSWKEGRSQALLSEGVLRVLSVFVERDCIPIEDASWTLYSRSTENLTEEICHSRSLGTSHDSCETFSGRTEADER